MRDKKFVINSIKMDLYRVVTAAGDIRKELPKQSVIEFMEHAGRDFEKTELTLREKELKSQLKNLLSQLNDLRDARARLKWTEDVMTIRCRL